MSSCCLAVNSHPHLTAQVLMCTAWLVGSTAALAQSDQGNASTVLIQRQGQQKQRLIEGQATTELSRRQAKELDQDSQPGLEPSLASKAATASAPQPVTEVDVLLQRQQRIQRLNDAKVGPLATP